MMYRGIFLTLLWILLTIGYSVHKILVESQVEVELVDSEDFILNNEINEDASMVDSISTNDTCTNNISNTNSHIQIGMNSNIKSNLSNEQEYRLLYIIYIFIYIYIYLYICIIVSIYHICNCKIYNKKFIFFVVFIVYCKL